MTEQAAVSVPDNMPVLEKTRATAVFLPALPRVGTAVSADQVLRIEADVTQLVPHIHGSSVRALDTA